MTDPSVLTHGNSSSFIGLFLDDTKCPIMIFSNMIRKSVAAPLMDLEGDDIRQMTGNANKSSSLSANEVPPPNSE